MARRNLFQPPPPPDADSTAAPSSEQKARFPNTGAMSGVKSTLKDVASNAVREISVDVIEESGPKDRLSFTDSDILTLAESIKAHGQQVPIMVRPISDKPGHYKIVYGRRRLRALRSLGIPAGRRRWEELADQSRSDSIDLEQVTATLQFNAAKSSDESVLCTFRFTSFSAPVNNNRFGC